MKRLVRLLCCFALLIGFSYFNINVYAEDESIELYTMTYQIGEYETGANGPINSVTNCEQYTAVAGKTYMIMIEYNGSQVPALPDVKESINNSLNSSGIVFEFEYGGMSIIGKTGAYYKFTPNTPGSYEVEIDEDHSFVLNVMESNEPTKSYTVTYKVGEFSPGRDEPINPITDCEQYTAEEGKKYKILFNIVFTNDSDGCEIIESIVESLNTSGVYFRNSIGACSSEGGWFAVEFTPNAPGSYVVQIDENHSFILNVIEEDEPIDPYTVVFRIGKYNGGIEPIDPVINCEQYIAVAGKEYQITISIRSTNGPVETEIIESIKENLTGSGVYFEEFAEAGTSDTAIMAFKFVPETLGTVDVHLDEGHSFVLNVIEEDESLKGNAYAVYMDTGELVFFRSVEAYTNKSSGTFYDIAGNEYSGTVYSDIETLSREGASTPAYIPWSEHRLQITTVRVAEGQTIQPISTADWFTGHENLTDLDLTGFDTSSTTNMGGMFSWCLKLITIDLTPLDTRNVTDISHMFSNCQNLQYLDLQNFNTSNVTNMSGLFSRCCNLKSLDLSGFDTSKVTKMDSMFERCYDLAELTTDNFDTSNVTTFSYMFSECTELKSLNLTMFDTSSATKMTYMFYKCENLVSLDLSGFDTSKVTRLFSMFQGCSNLTHLDVSGFNTNNVEDMSGLFSDCISLKTVKIGAAFTRWKDHAFLPEGLWVNDRINMRLGEDKLYELFPGNPAYYSGEWTRSLFGKAYAVSTEENDLIFFRSMESYEDCSTGVFIDVDGTEYQGIIYSNVENRNNGLAPWRYYSDCIKSVKVAEGQVIQPMSMAEWFSWCESLTTVDLSGFDVQYVTDMSSLFYNCTDLIRVEFGGFNTTAVTNMGYMFYNCSSLKSLDLSNFDTANATNMEYMFYNCSSLESLDLSSFYTTNVTKMDALFGCCDSLKKIVLGQKFTKWNSYAYLPEGLWKNEEKNLVFTEEELYSAYPSRAYHYAGEWNLIDKSKAYAVLTNDGEMTFFRSNNKYYGEGSRGVFTDVRGNEYSGRIYVVSESTTVNGSKTVEWASVKSEIKQIRVAENQTITPIDMNSWFKDCNKLSNIDLEGFDTSTVTNMTALFSGCSQLTEIDFSKFDTSSVRQTEKMFYQCSRLENLDLTNFNTGQVINMQHMFSGCINLVTLDISSFEISEGTGMTSMFLNCKKLSEVKLGERFTWWYPMAPLPTGIWINEEIDLALTETELYDQYPSNASLYKGVWKKAIVKGIELNKHQLNLRIGSTERLIATIIPDVLVDAKYSWSSDNQSVAEINKYGVVSPMKPGVTNITVTTEDGGYTDTCKVTVLFDDVTQPSQYYYDAVYWAVENDITQGMGPTTFNPGGFCKRYQFVLFLWRQAGCPEPELTEDPFTDVLSDPKKDVYEKAVLWAVDKEITTGTTPTTFDPYAPLTRGQVVTFLYRAAGKPEVSTTTNPFKDLDSSKYYYKSVLWAVENNITTGLNKTQFGPTNTCTRGQTVLFMYRLFKDEQTVAESNH